MLKDEIEKKIKKKTRKKHLSLPELTNQIRDSSHEVGIIS
jgi:hypothetical protein